MEFDFQLDKIYNGKTKKYFQEVISSYYNGNFRAAIVVLYSVVMADIIYKLETLRDVYGERNAEVILKTVNTLIQSDPLSARWEKGLLDGIKGANGFFDISTHENIRHLRELRHLTAHPALDQGGDLYLPSKYEVASCISNMLDGVLTKPPLFIKIVTERLLKDSVLDSLKDMFLVDYDSHKKYMEERYFKHMNIKMFKEVFKDIWKLTFCKDNEDCKKNKQVNCQLLKIMMERNTVELLSEINDNKNDYSNVLPGLIYDICRFITMFPEIYTRLGEPAKTMIQTNAARYGKIKTISFFVPGSIEEHLKELDCTVARVHYDEIKILEEAIKKYRGGNISIILSYYIDWFAKQNTYDNADYYFNMFIKPNIDLFTKDQIISLIEAINSDPNGQLSGRWRAKRDNTIIYNYAKDILPKDFDYSKYENFKIDETGATPT